MRKFELVEGSFQEQGASKWRTWWSRWGYYSAERVEAPETP